MPNDRRSTVVVRRPMRSGLREIALGIGEAMRRRSDLCLNEEGSDCAVIHTSELLDQNPQAIKRTAVAEERQRQAFLFNDILGEPRPLRRAPEAAPGMLTRALKINDGDVAGRGTRRRHQDVERLAHFVASKRDFRLPRPVFSSVETIDFTTMSGCPSATYSTRHSTVVPVPFGLAVSVPV